MKKKLFVVSDIHSFCTPLIKALDKSGFDPYDENHWLIVCGDVFDRGYESVEVLHFLMSLERKVLVKGNHDSLLEECCMREFPYSHDNSNGTTRTIKDIGGAKYGKPFDECCRITWNKLARYRELLVNYFETQNYIFVHSWIPCKLTSRIHPADKWATLVDREYMEDWRDANDVEYEEAMWNNPFWKAKNGMNKTGKTIVFGHWHCSLGHSIDSDGELSEFGDDACWEPYFNEEQSIIGIDRCVAHTGELNVIVLEDELIDD